MKGINSLADVQEKDFKKITFIIEEEDDFKSAVETHIISFFYSVAVLSLFLSVYIYTLYVECLTLFEYLLLTLHLI